MELPCTISLRNDDSSVMSTYCYNDGNLGNVGITLYQYYETTKRIEQLIKMGHMQNLRPEIDIPKGSKHSIHHPIANVTTFIKRDNGVIPKGNISFQSFDTLADYKKNFLFEEYNYLFNHAEQLWYLFNPFLDQFKELGKMLLESPALNFPDETMSFIRDKHRKHQ